MKRSESIIEFAKALSAFNAEVGAMAKDAKNPFFKSDYLSLDKIIEETRTILQKNGLSVMQFPSGDGTTVSVTTMLLHTSGEFIEAEPLIMRPVKNDPQSLGSAISYARRYAYQAILSLNTGAEDDDGNRASDKNKGGQQSQPPNNYSKNNNNTKPNNNNTVKQITDPQKKALGAKLDKLVKLYNNPDITKDSLLAKLEEVDEIGVFGSVSGLTASKASLCINKLEVWITNVSKQGESQ